MHIQCPVWCHGTKENQWMDSGWFYRGKMYWCLYTDSKDGQDKVIGRQLEQQYRKDKNEQDS